MSALAVLWLLARVANSDPGKHLQTVDMLANFSSWVYSDCVHLSERILCTFFPAGVSGCSDRLSKVEHM
jgi:hypothetical protein